jgi:toxin ParE1/3/4
MAISQENPSVGLRFMDAASESIQRLAEMPRMGGLLNTSNPHLSSYRVWPVRGFDNYLIIYRILPNSLAVVRILHGARDIEAVLGGNES